MNAATHDFHPGDLVRARNREWVVQAADNRLNDGSSLLRLRPLGGADEGIITLIPELEFFPVESATCSSSVLTIVRDATGTKLERLRPDQICDEPPALLLRRI